VTMAEITLLSVAQAREGFEFIYNGGGPVCRTCLVAETHTW